MLPLIAQSDFEVIAAALSHFKHNKGIFTVINSQNGKTRSCGNLQFEVPKMRCRRFDHLVVVYDPEITNKFLLPRSDEETKLIRSKDFSIDKICESKPNLQPTSTQKISESTKLVLIAHRVQEARARQKFCHKTGGGRAPRFESQHETEPNTSIITSFTIYKIY